MLAVKILQWRKLWMREMIIICIIIVGKEVCEAKTDAVGVNV